MKKGFHRGCAFICTAKGSIRRILANDLNARIKHARLTFPEMAEPECRERVQQFLEHLRTRGAAASYAVRFRIGGEIITLDCSGASFGKDFLVIAAPDCHAIERYSERLLETKLAQVKALESAQARKISERWPDPTVSLQTDGRSLETSEPREPLDAG